MNSLRLFLLVVFVLPPALNYDLVAQEPPLKPAPPFVADMPAVSGWRIMMTYKRGSPAPADQNSPAYAAWKKSTRAISEVLISKSGNRKRVIAQYMQGAQGESYMIGGYEYEHKAGYVAGRVNVNSHFASHGDFFELAWLSLDNYKDIESLDGKKYFVFKDGDATSGREAWIDASTKRPLKFNDDVYDRVYEFPATPPISIEPSELIAKRAALDNPIK